ncbi:MAG: hypothetical protein AAGE59_16600 [Cyanobacteria bacterium P01_F01_bin.86]
MLRGNNTVANEQIWQVAAVNSAENFQALDEKPLENLFIERMEGNEEIFIRLMNNDEFRQEAAGALMWAVYNQIRDAA